MASNPSTRVLFLLLACVVLLASGCASRPHNPDDPLEGYNRAMFSFNEGLDKAIVKPAAQAYDAVTPDPVQTGIGNVLSNLGDVWIGVNNLLQGKVGDGMTDIMRFAFNTTLGMLGIIDVASEMGLPKHDEDFGQTLAVWGVDEGPYVVLPLFGPRTVRDAAALPVDFAVDTVAEFDHVPTRNTVTGVRIIHGRSILLRADRTLDEQIDKYAFVRDAYLQQRRYKVYDGNPPIEYEDFDVERKGARGVLYETEADAVAVAALANFEFLAPAAVDSASRHVSAGDLR